MSLSKRLQKRQELLDKKVIEVNELWISLDTSVCGGRIWNITYELDGLQFHIKNKNGDEIGFLKIYYSPSIEIESELKPDLISHSVLWDFYISSKEFYEFTIRIKTEVELI